MKKESLRQRLAGMTPRQKLAYMWTYYKLPILGAALGLVLLISGVVRLASPKKETLVRLVLLSPADPGEQALDSLLPALGYDPAGTRLSLTVLELADEDGAVMSARGQLLQGLFLSEEVDALAAGESVFSAFAERNAFLDPASYLPPAVLEKYRDRLVPLPEGGGACGLRLTAASPLWKTLGLPPGERIWGVAVRCWDLTAAARLTLYVLGEDPAVWQSWTPDGG